MLDIMRHINLYYISHKHINHAPTERRQPAGVGRRTAAGRPAPAAEKNTRWLKNTQKHVSFLGLTKNTKKHFSHLGLLLLAPMKPKHKRKS